MCKLTKKLNSKRGVTIVMALLFFLVATMVSSVVIAVANTATRKVIYDRKEQQAYLTVVDIAEYLQEEIQKYQFNITEKYSSDSTMAQYILTPTQGCDLDHYMDRIKNYCYFMISGDEAYYEELEEPYVFIIQFDQIDIKNAKYQLSKDDIDDVKVTITPDMSDAGSKDLCDLYITIESPVVSSLSKNQTVNYRMTVYMKSNKVSTKLNSEVHSKIDEYGYAYDIITESTQVDYFWVIGSVEKGFGDSL